VVPICNKIEAEIAELEEDEKADFLESLGFEEPGLNRVIRAGYRLLGLHHLLHRWPQGGARLDHSQGTRAPQAAAAIHTDFERGFIRAEVIAYADYVACGGEQGAKDAGKWRLEGKEYVVQDGDVILFRFNV
jgi:ribosome-binding ATPase